MKIAKSAFARLAMGVAIVATSAMSGAFAQTYSLRVSTVIAESDPLYEGYVRFGKAVEERTKGDMKVDVFPNAQLGQDEDLMEQALLGANVAFNTDAGRLGQRVPAMGIILAPYVFSDPKQAEKLYASDLYKGWVKELEEKHGLTVLALNYYVGARHFLTKEPFKTPGDLAGRKIRTPGAPVWQETIRALGATPVALPWIETYPALQQGVVDGAEAQHPGSYGQKFHEVAPHITKTGHILLMNGPVVGTGWFKSLPEEYQTILREEAVKAGTWTTERVLAMEGDFESKMVAEGAIVHEVDVGLFREASKKVFSVLNLQETKDKVDAVLNAK
ncbi:MAG: C4-dicarboxylate TRAP transporter substrate-binding protein [Propionivibrio sp.]